MNKLSQLIKQSHFAIFTIFVLVLAVIVVIGFNAIIANNIQRNPPEINASSSGADSQLKSFDEKTASRLRELSPSANVTSAPDLSNDGRLNPFAE